MGAELITFGDLARGAGLTLLAAQVPLLLLLLARLMPGRTRRAPIAPRLAPRTDTTVTVIVATLNEAKRIGPCLEGLMAQQAPLLEVLIVDSRSTDGTRELVQAAAARDPRIRLITDEPLPAGWVGKVWALETGLRHAKGEWVLGIDADTVPAPGLVGAVVDAIEQDDYDVASFSPQFRDQTAAERFVQPAMLVTLVYRCGAAGATQPPRVGFHDGSRIIQVRAYVSLAEMWREWGRSFDLKDATPTWRRWVDVALVWSAQALPLPLVLLLLTVAAFGGAQSTGSNRMLLEALLLVNASALLVRLMMLVALRGSYAERGWSFWFSWLSDIAAAWRLTLSTARTPTRWRGRQYDTLLTDGAS